MLAPSGEPSTVAVPWLILAGLVLILAPSQIWLGVPVWERGVGAVAQAAGLAAAFWVVAVLKAAGDRTRYGGVMLSIAAGAASLAVFYLAVLILSPSYSRGVLLIGSAGFGLLLLGPSLFPRWIGVSTWVLGSGVAALVLSGMTTTGTTATAGTAVDTLVAHHGRLVAQHLTAVGDTIPGGGLARVDGDVLVVTGAGEFFRVPLSEGRFVAERLPFTAPLNRDDFVAATDTTVRHWRFRVAGILARPADDSVRVLVSHHFWKVDEGCFVLRLSETTAPRDLGAEWPGSESGWPVQWNTLFETSPCLPIKDRGHPFAGQQAGGRIAALGDSAYILTVGDHQFDGLNSRRAALSQALDNDYGKTILIPRKGTPRTLTAGHRNPQGLLVSSTGEIWVTEHGPRGGDELNLLVDGANYGWPLHTLGERYDDAPTDPIGTPGPMDGAFTMASFAWLPSIGISNLIEIQTDAMPRWRGDLLVASLVNRGLHRLHRVEGRFVYSERIETGARVRDLIETVDGRIMLWFDDRRLSLYTPTAVESTGFANSS